MTTRFAKLRHTVGWAVVDQSLASAGNFAVTLTAAHMGSSSEFGVFSLSVSAYLIVLGLIRAATTTPLFVRYNPEDVSSATSEAVLANGLILALIGSVLLLIIGSAIGHLTLFAVMGASTPFLVAQDNVRYLLLARRTPRLAAANDALNLTLTLALVAPLALAHVDAMPLLVLAWGAAGLLAAVYGLRQLSTRLGWRGAVTFLRSHRDLKANLAAESATMTASSQGLGYAVVGISGLTVVAGYRAAGQLILGPLNLFFMGVLPQIQLEVNRRYRRGDERFAAIAAAALAAIALSTGLIVSLLLPTSVGHALAGSSWNSARGFVLPCSVFLAGSSVSSCCFARLRHSVKPSRLRDLRLFTSGVLMLSAIVSLLVADASGLRFGLILGGCANAAISLFALRRITYTSASEPRRLAHHV